MRSLLILSAIIAQAFACATGFAQTRAGAAPERQGIILIRVSPSMDSAIGAVFYGTRPVGDPAFSHSDINQSILSGDSLIHALLKLPGALHGLQLRPFIPTHSVAFEDIRERSNPQLFQGPTYSIVNSNDSLSTQHSALSTLLRSSESNIAHWFALYYSDSISGDRAVAYVRKSSLIQLAEPKYIREQFGVPIYTPNDPDVPQQYALQMMNCFEAWDVVRCDSTMIVADDDVGTDWTHEDLAASIYENPGEIGLDKNGVDKRYNGIDDDSNGYIDDWHGWDFGGANGVAPDNNPMPGAGIDHGTQTAGILAATGNNEIGIAGVAFGARLIPIKVSCDVCEYLDFGFEGIMYAADMRAKLVNCSWGGSGRSDAEQDVINYAYAKDCAVVVAAGNNGVYQDFYPASYNNVLSVAAIDQNRNNASFSNFNTHVDVSAPGVAVMSTIPGNGYTADPQHANGTSFASPNTAGVVALVRQRFPNWMAGQAMQQVRVTGNPELGLDSNQIYFEGHGEVDAFQAVTDTNTFSARVDTFSIADEKGTGSFQPGESGSIIVRAMNYLKPLSNLKAKVELVSIPGITGANYVTLEDSVVTFGAVGTLQTISNPLATLRLTVAGNVPDSTHVLLRLFFYDSTVGYTSVGGHWGDYDYISFIINPSYLDLDTNNITATFSSTGSIGYNDPTNNTEGSGLSWRNPPNPVSVLAGLVLGDNSDGAGLMVGTDSIHVVDVVFNPGGNADADLTPQRNIHYAEPPDRINAAQELAFSMTDSLADSSVMVGLNASCQAYEFTQGLAANAIVAKYVFRARPGGLLAASDSAAAALFFDWDISSAGLNNMTFFDSAVSSALTYSLDPNYPYIGMKLLSALPAGAELNYHAIKNDSSQGDINFYSNYSRPAKWLSMTEYYPIAGPGDISHTFGLKNMPIHSQDSVEMTVVIALAENTQLLQQTIGEVDSLWTQTAGVGLEAPAWAGASSPALEVFPNPFRSTLHIAWDENGPATLTIYDAIGRVIVSKSVTGSQFDFSPPDIPSGFYVIDVAVGGTHLRRQVVASK